jgi:hypothetical protein
MIWQGLQSIGSVEDFHISFVFCVLTRQIDKVAGSQGVVRRTCLLSRTS